VLRSFSRLAADVEFAFDLRENASDDMEPLSIDSSSDPAGTLASAPMDELASAHARTLERALAGEFDRQSRRMAFASQAEICGFAAELMQDFAEDLLNDLLILAERHTSPGAEWVMRQLTTALVETAAALEEAAPPAARPSIANVLQVTRVDFEWRCRATLGLPSSATLGDPAQL
jgi:hypothetical protein